ncbi:MAG: HEAT repeat domain-containing protein [Anaerolineae bacterium]|nr:HEAT repeat domain-containing protein [Anaerolineae bacterium]
MATRKDNSPSLSTQSGQSGREPRLGGEAAYHVSAIEGLASKDWQVRARSAEQLGVLQKEVALPYLAQLLQDANGRVREAAMNSLIKFGEPAVPHLIDVLRLGQPKQVRTARFALIRMGGAAVPGLVQAFRTGNDFLRPRIVHVLAGIRHPQSVAFLIELLGNTNGKIRDAACDALHDLGHRHAVPALVQALDDTDPNRRHNVIELLGVFQYEPVVPALIQRLREPYKDVQEAITTLARIGTSEAIDELTELLWHEVDAYREAAARGLGLARAESALSMLCFLAESDASHTVRGAAIGAVAAMGSAEALSRLEEIVHRKGAAEFHPQIIQILGMFFNHPSVIPILLEIARDPAHSENAMSTLSCAIGPSEEWDVTLRALAVQNLITAADDDDVRIRGYAVQALMYLPDALAIPVLIRRLSDSSSIADHPFRYYFTIDGPGNTLICEDAADALESIGTPEALAALEKFRRENG